MSDAEGGGGHARGTSEDDSDSVGSQSSSAQNDAGQGAQGAAGSAASPRSSGSGDESDIDQPAPGAPRFSTPEDDAGPATGPPSSSSASSASFSGDDAGPLSPVAADSVRRYNGVLVFDDHLTDDDAEHGGAAGIAEEAVAWFMALPHDPVIVRVVEESIRDAVADDDDRHGDGTRHTWGGVVLAASEYAHRVSISDDGGRVVNRYLFGAAENGGEPFRAGVDVAIAHGDDGTVSAMYTGRGANADDRWSYTKLRAAVASGERPETAVGSYGAIIENLYTIGVVNMLAAYHAMRPVPAIIQPTNAPVVDDLLPVFIDALARLLFLAAHNARRVLIEKIDVMYAIYRDTQDAGSIAAFDGFDDLRTNAWGGAIDADPVATFAVDAFIDAFVDGRAESTAASAAEVAASVHASERASGNSDGIGDDDVSQRISGRGRKSSARRASRRKSRRGASVASSTRRSARLAAKRALVSKQAQIDALRRGTVGAGRAAIMAASSSENSDDDDDDGDASSSIAMSHDAVGESHGDAYLTPERIVQSARAASAYFVQVGSALVSVFDASRVSRADPGTLRQLIGAMIHGTRAAGDEHGNRVRQPPDDDTIDDAIRYLRDVNAQETHGETRWQTRRRSAAPTRYSTAYTVVDPQNGAYGAVGADLEGIVGWAGSGVATFGFDGGTEEEGRDTSYRDVWTDPVVPVAASVAAAPLVAYTVAGADKLSGRAALPWAPLHEVVDQRAVDWVIPRKMPQSRFPVRALLATHLDVVARRRRWVPTVAPSGLTYDNDDSVARAPWMMAHATAWLVARVMTTSRLTEQQLGLFITNDAVTPLERLVQLVERAPARMRDVLSFAVKSCVTYNAQAAAAVHGRSGLHGGAKAMQRTVLGRLLTALALSRAGNARGADHEDSGPVEPSDAAADARSETGQPDGEAGPAAGSIVRAGDEAEAAVAGSDDAAAGSGVGDDSDNSSDASESSGGSHEYDDAVAAPRGHESLRAAASDRGLSLSALSAHPGPESPRAAESPRAGAMTLADLSVGRLSVGGNGSVLGPHTPDHSAVDSDFRAWSLRAAFMSANALRASLGASAHGDDSRTDQERLWAHLQRNSGDANTPLSIFMDYFRRAFPAEGGVYDDDAMSKLVVLSAQLEDATRVITASGAFAYAAQLLSGDAVFNREANADNDGNNDEKGGAIEAPTRNILLAASAITLMRESMPALGDAVDAAAFAITYVAIPSDNVGGYEAAFRFMMAIISPLSLRGSVSWWRTGLRNGDTGDASQVLEDIKKDINGSDEGRFSVALSFIANEDGSERRVTQRAKDAAFAELADTSAGAAMVLFHVFNRDAGMALDARRVVMDSFRRDGPTSDDGDDGAIDHSESSNDEGAHEVLFDGGEEQALQLFRAYFTAVGGLWSKPGGFPREYPRRIIGAFRARLDTFDRVSVTDLDEYPIDVPAPVAFQFDDLGLATPPQPEFGILNAIATADSAAAGSVLFGSDASIKAAAVGTGPSAIDLRDLAAIRDVVRAFGPVLEENAAVVERLNTHRDGDVYRTAAQQAAADQVLDTRRGELVDALDWKKKTDAVVAAFLEIQHTLIENGMDAVLVNLRVHSPALGAIARAASTTPDSVVQMAGSDDSLARLDSLADRYAGRVFVDGIHVVVPEDTGQKRFVWHERVFGFTLDGMFAAATEAFGNAVDTRFDAIDAWNTFIDAAIYVYVLALVLFTGYAEKRADEAGAAVSSALAAYNTAREEATDANTRAFHARELGQRVAEVAATISESARAISALLVRSEEAAAAALDALGGAVADASMSDVPAGSGDGSHDGSENGRGGDDGTSSRRNAASIAPAPDTGGDSGVGGSSVRAIVDSIVSADASAAKAAPCIYRDIRRAIAVSAGPSTRDDARTPTPAGAIGATLYEAAHGAISRTGVLDDVLSRFVSDDNDPPLMPITAEMLSTFRWLALIQYNTVGSSDAPPPDSLRDHVPTGVAAAGRAAWFDGADAPAVGIDTGADASIDAVNRLRAVLAHARARGDAQQVVVAEIAEALAVVYPAHIVDDEGVAVHEVTHAIGAEEADDVARAVKAAAVLAVAVAAAPEDAEDAQRVGQITAYRRMLYAALAVARPPDGDVPPQWKTRIENELELAADRIERA